MNIGSPAADMESFTLFENTIKIGDLVSIHQTYKVFEGVKRYCFALKLRNLCMI